MRIFTCTMRVYFCQCGPRAIGSLETLPVVERGVTAFPLSFFFFSLLLFFFSSPSFFVFSSSSPPFFFFSPPPPLLFITLIPFFSCPSSSSYFSSFLLLPPLPLPPPPLLLSLLAVKRRQILRWFRRFALISRVFSVVVCELIEAQREEASVAVFMFWCNCGGFE